MGRMAYPRKLLGDGEEVVAELRPHVKELYLPTAALLLLLPAAVYVGSVVPDGGAQRSMRIAVGLLALGLLLYASVLPYLRWFTTLYVITDRRVITRHGIIARSGRDMPLSRVNDVSFEHSGLLDRLLGCGTLVVESAGERGQLVLRDLPQVEEVQRDIYRLVAADEERRRQGADRLPDDEPGW
jgi:uncharacterized membrane protein YdbT with pleckstrin-like domain